MYSINKHVFKWACVGQKGVRFAVLPKSLSTFASANDWRELYARLRFEGNLNTSALVVDNLSENGVPRIKGYGTEETVCTFEWNKTEEMIDDLQGKGFKYITFCGFEKLDTLNLCRLFENLRELDKPYLIFPGAYRPELYAKYWGKNKLQGSPPGIDRREERQYFHGYGLPDLVQKLVDDCKFLYPQNQNQLSRSIYELSLLTNSDTQIVDHITSRTQFRRSLESGGSADLSTITKDLVGRGVLLEIIKARFEKLDEKQKEIARKLFASGYYCLPVKDSENYDENLVLIEPLFLNSLANIDSNDNFHFLTPFSPLISLVFNRNSSAFGASSKSYFHYDVNHAEASRLVNDIENFFRSQIKFHISRKFHSDQESMSQNIDSFLDDFPAHKSYEEQIAEFLHETIEITDEQKEKIMPILRKDVWDLDEGRTYRTVAKAKRNKSISTTDFVAENTDLLYFLNPHELQTILKKITADEAFLPEKGSMEEFFKILNLVRNDVSHNRPIASDRLDSLSKKFLDIQREVGKKVGLDEG